MRHENNQTTIKMRKQTTYIITGKNNGQVNYHRFKKELDRF